MLLTGSRTLLVLGGLLAVRTASAEPPGCIRDHVRAQELQLDGQLRAARDRLVACSAAADCPAPIAAECTKLLESTQRSIPSVVFAVVDSAGRDLTQITVELAGTLLAREVGAEAVELDPGTHEFVFTDAAGTEVRETVVLRASEQRRVVRVTFPNAAPEEAAGVPADAGLPLTFYIAGAVGVVGLASFTYFGLDGLRREDEMLDGGCAPNCSQAQADARYQQFVIADVSLGISAVAFGAAAIIWALHDPQEQPGVQVGLLPSADGLRVRTRVAW